MNNTIDFNTAKTIDTMSKKIDHIDDTVSGFFSFMHMVMQNELGNAEPYFAAVSPVLDLTVIRPDDAPHILPCFDEADEGIGISEDEPLGFRYNPKQVIKLMGKRYLVGPVIFHRFDDERDFASLTMSDMYTIQKRSSARFLSKPLHRKKQRKSSRKRGIMRTMFSTPQILSVSISKLWVSRNFLKAEKWRFFWFNPVCIRRKPPSARN